MCTLEDKDIPFKEGDILFNTKSSSYERKYGTTKFNNHRLVVAFTNEAAPPTKLTNKDEKILKDYFEAGQYYLEVECNENGYPILEDNKLVITHARGIPTMSSTPEEALKKIIEFNERNSKNSKSRQ